MSAWFFLRQRTYRRKICLRVAARISVSNHRPSAKRFSRHKAEHHTKGEQDTEYSFSHFALPPGRYAFLRFTVSTVQAPPLMNSIRLLLSPVWGEPESLGMTVFSLRLAPQTVHSSCLMPVASLVAALSITHWKLCAAVSALLPHSHSCQWLVSSYFHSVP